MVINVVDFLGLKRRTVTVSEVKYLEFFLKSLLDLKPGSVIEFNDFKVVRLFNNNIEIKK